MEPPREVLREAVQLHPDEALISYNLACYACVLGELGEARQLLALATAINPDLKALALDDPDFERIFGAGS